MWESCSIRSPNLLYKARLWDCGNFVMVEYINTEQFFTNQAQACAYDYIAYPF